VGATSRGAGSVRMVAWQTAIAGLRDLSADELDAVTRVAPARMARCCVSCRLRQRRRPVHLDPPTGGHGGLSQHQHGSDIRGAGVASSATSSRRLVALRVSVGLRRVEAAGEAFRLV
jgi:hypothetical protein